MARPRTLDVFPDPSKAYGMQVCAACGQENPDIARFCLACGHPLDTEPAPGREERRVVSILFVDLVGFTSQADTLDPEEVRAILTPYHDTVRREIESFGGVVEKFIGDAVMAVFGAPTAFGDDAERAIRAALAVRDTITNAHLRIAVNTGQALVSLTARPGYGESMVAGDVVNTASRLQQAAPVDGILVGEETYRATRGVVKYEPAPAVAAKGKTEPIRAWLAVRGKTAEEAATPQSALVGRRRELGLLRGIWDRVVEERAPHLVMVLGPPGVGKTRLTQEFSHVVEELGGQSVRGRSLPYRDSSAYGAFASQVKQLCHVFESDPTSVARDKMHRTLTSLLDGAGADEVADHLAILMGLDRERTVSDREALFFSVRRFLEAVARDRPTMLVFEDLHWADSSLLDLVELLAARLRDLPILVVAQSRPELLDVRPTWGGGLPAYTALPLGPLNEEDSRELAAQRLADAALADGLVETAAGNPLFIEQLAATLNEAPTGQALPTTIREILAARLDALPLNERALLLDAAVSGKTFWRGALERMTTNGAALSDLLGALERRDLIRRETVSAIEGEQQFTFTHVLIRDAAYELLPRARRQERHAQVARFLEDVTAEVGEAGAALARHWRDAGDHARAVEYFVAAAEQAEQGWAKGRAVTFYREALDLVPPDDDERRSALRRRLAVAHAAVYHLPDARLLQQEQELAGEV